MAKFLPLSAEFQSISIKDGNWIDAEAHFHELAADAHLDLFLSLCPSVLRSPVSAHTATDHFRHLWDSPSLAALYGECVDLVKFFCFSSDDVFASSARRPRSTTKYSRRCRSECATSHRGGAAASFAPRVRDRGT
jgi:hypothetical protein